MNVKGFDRDIELKIGQRLKTLQSKLFLKELKALDDRHLRRNLSCVERSDGTHISINGRDFIDFSSNDYLNLSSHKDIASAAIKAIGKYGYGSGSSRLLGGTLEPHIKLEERIASFKNTEAALVFNTGYAANTGVIPAVTGENDIIYSDELNHASIVDGARLSKASIKIYKHRNAEDLERLLKKDAASNRGMRLIVTDTVFSMDGDIAPLKEIFFLAGKYNAILMIDDAHGTGVMGDNGRGTLEYFGMAGEGIIQMGTLSKAAGCFGAFIAGSRELIDLLISKSRSFIYSTSLPPAAAAAGIKAIDIIDKRSVRLRHSLWKNRDRLFTGLNNLGLDTMGSETPIIPVMAGTINDVLRTADILSKNGVFAPAIRPPTVPEGKCRIRFSVTAGHTDKDIDRVLDVMKECG